MDRYTIKFKRFKRDPENKYECLCCHSLMIPYKHTDAFYFLDFICPECNTLLIIETHGDNYCLSTGTEKEMYRGFWEVGLECKESEPSWFSIFPKIE